MAAAQPLVVRLSGGRLHHVSTCNPPPVLFCASRAGAFSVVPGPSIEKLQPLHGTARTLSSPFVSEGYGNATMNGSQMRVYFDYNATTPLAPEVIEAVVRATRDQFGNASSVHHFGQQAKAVLDDARSAIATLLGGDPSEVVFTSSGTESDNFAIRGAAEAIEPTGRR